MYIPLYDLWHKIQIATTHDQGDPLTMVMPCMDVCMYGCSVPLIDCIAGSIMQV